jgi:hypothetical protein
VAAASYEARESGVRLLAEGNLADAAPPLDHSLRGDHLGAPRKGRMSG